MSVFDRATVKNTRETITKLIQAEMKKLGVAVTCDSASFSRDGLNATFKLKMEVVSKGVQKEVKNAEKALFELHCKSVGLKKSDYQRSVYIRNTPFKISGVKIGTRTENRVLITNLRTNKVYIINKDAVLSALKSKK